MFPDKVVKEIGEALSLWVKCWAAATVVLVILAIYGLVRLVV